MAELAFRPKWSLSSEICGGRGGSSAPLFLRASSPVAHLQSTIPADGNDSAVFFAVSQGRHISDVGRDHLDSPKRRSIERNDSTAAACNYEFAAARVEARGAGERVAGEDAAVHAQQRAGRPIKDADIGPRRRE